MGDSFDNVGTFKLASSGRSLALDITPPNSVFSFRCYIGLKDLDKVTSKRKKNGAIFILKEGVRPNYKTREQRRRESKLDL